ncbi:MAG: GDP-mannose 4,6-dehydratase, partial [Planctomycetaceae bacterium]|nr:GDP-mannose 4,6-dehydratase [Planctomycetaceae bacterium]
MNTPIAIITGITGQDGSYLRDLLLRKGYEVHGWLRSSKSMETQPTLENLYYHIADFANGDSLTNLMTTIRPQEIYHLAAQSNVRASFDDPLTTTDVNAMGTLRLLESIRKTQENIGQQIRLFHASSGEIFGPNTEAPLTETSPFNPQSPYGISKTCAHWSVPTVRRAY